MNIESESACCGDVGRQISRGIKMLASFDISGVEQ
jgi:hypothetical protein